VDGRRSCPRAALSASPITVDRRAARETAQRRRARRDRTIATVSTIVVVGALATAIVTSKGWPNVRATFFSWSSLKDAFPDILRGFWLDVRIFLTVEAIVLVLGLVIALARSSRVPALAPLRLLGTLFVDLFRGIPTILVIYLIGFGVPALELSGVPSDPVILGGAALALSYSAYVAEVYRAGIESVHPSQRAAALALGLSGGQAMRFVILPQAVRRVIPPLMNDFIGLQKDTALLNVVGVLEGFNIARIYAGNNFNLSSVTGLGICFLVVTIPMTRLADYLVKRDQQRMQGGGG
jgi:polar amino acid transport system permease protein